MCGIAGIVAPGNPQTGLLGLMLGSLVHRGPDGSGVFTCVLGNRGLAMGHRRLAILDLTEAGAQPMADATDQFVVTYNGEIYNFLEIKAELEGRGVKFRSHSDTEVLLEAYKAWGSECLGHLNGMFAFAILDRPKGKLFCARDRYGEKPFLFSFGKDFFAFASEYKALLQHPSISLDLDERRLLQAAHYPGSGLDADTETVFKAVKQLMPGHAMEIDLRSLNFRSWQYWKIIPGERDPSGSEAEVFAEYRELLVDAVRLRLRSDVPVGSCLSGGLDSSAIVCIVRKLLGASSEYRTFTGRFPGSSADEWEFALKVIDDVGVVNYSVEPTAQRFLEDLAPFMWHNELPVSSSSQYAQWCVFRLAKEHGVTVLLDGQGADESLGGYEQYFANYIQALEERGDRTRLAKELPLIRQRYPSAFAPAGRKWRERMPFRTRHWLSNRLGKGTNLLYGIEVDLAEGLNEQRQPTRKPGFNSLSNALESDTFGRSLTTLLRYGDRNSMAHSREVRLPFCDHRLAEFVFSLPPHLLMGEIQTKRILREAMRGILPEPIRARWNKQGFRPPQDLWFRSEKMVEAVREAFSSSTFSHGGLWKVDWWQRAISRIEAGELTLGWVVWQPFMIEVWKREFVARIATMRKQRDLALFAC